MSAFLTAASDARRRWCSAAFCWAISIARWSSAPCPLSGDGFLCFRTVALFDQLIDVFRCTIFRVSRIQDICAASFIDDFGGRSIEGFKQTWINIILVLSQISLCRNRVLRQLGLEQLTVVTAA